jgi:hypothetical protein
MLGATRVGKVRTDTYSILQHTTYGNNCNYQLGTTVEYEECRLLGRYALWLL